MEKDFIDQIKTIPLTARQYAALSFPRHEIRKRIAGYHVRRKKCPQNIESGDPLLRLVSDYDLSHLRIGFLTFDTAVSTDDDYHQVGTYLDAFLCVSRHNGCVTMMRDIYEPESPANRDYFCADDSENFLHALIAAGTFLERGYYDDRLYVNIEMIDAMVLYCEDVAGSGSADFFRELLLYHHTRQSID